MKIGLKLWSQNIDYYLHEAARLYEKGVYHYIELYAAPGTTELIPHWAALGIPFTVHCAHSAHGFNLADPTKAAENLRHFSEAKAFADALKADFIIVHGGIGHREDEVARQLSALDDARVLIENKPYLPIPSMSQASSCRGYAKKELESLMNQAKVGFCLDFVHAVCAANSQKIDIYEYIGELMSLNPSMYHLSNVLDVASEVDSHIHLSRGELKLGKIIASLPQDAKVTLETEKNSPTSLADFEEDVHYFKKFDISMRRAELRDSERLMNLRNDDLVVQSSFNQSKVASEEHERWFKRVLVTPSTELYILENACSDFVGQVRFDTKNEEEHLISIAISPEFRGHSLGSEIIKKATQHFSQKRKGGKIVAEIRPENGASIASFVGGGYELEAELEGKLRYVKELK